MDAETRRLKESREHANAWKRWGPYLSERQWGTVREDYSQNGDAWNYLTHEQSRSYAYRWGEDGLAGISDDHQRLCFSIALWNEADPILKERAFGLTNNEGNHGEDLKEYYFYLDSTPTHSYMRYLYKYPQSAFPYNDLVETNRSRGRDQFEYELLDTGIFNDDKYFDVFVEYAKEGPEDLAISITAHNRGPDTARLHILPTLWFRNTWWGDQSANPPVITKGNGKSTIDYVMAQSSVLGKRYLFFDGKPDLLFCNNETNNERLFGRPNATPYVKDGINDAVVKGDRNAVDDSQTGSKVAADYATAIPAGGSTTIRLRLTDREPNQFNTKQPVFGAEFDELIARRKREADRFYAGIIPKTFSNDERLVVRQALAGMLWSKQYYFYDVARWMEQHGAEPPSRDVPRNGEWFHLVSDNVLSMPDKWEYPWFAAWDLAFHTVALSVVDSDFAKEQLGLMLDDLFLHPNGQIPAYEWNFGDVNPPVHAWATYYVYTNEKDQTGHGDIGFLERSFHRLLLNFTWWVNRKDASGRNLFQGGFLGLDNIGVFDRNSELPGNGILEQADGTAWMALYCQNMLQIALELAMDNPIYESMAIKFLEHFLWIGSAMDRMGVNHDGLWNDEDGFFYDVLRFPDGSGTPLKVRSTVGLLPLAAATVIEPEMIGRFPSLVETITKFVEHQPHVVESIARPGKPGVRGRVQLSVLNETKLRQVLTRMLDESEFLSEFGLRAVSREHLEHPYSYYANGEDHLVKYLPAESDSGMFGGNSNWRGPIWFPTNTILLRALLNLYFYYGDEFKIECPTGSGHNMTLLEVAQDISRRLANIFLRDQNGHRPVFGGMEKFQTNKYWRDNLLFHEYFHGDNGAGIGASHQTGWTGLVARLMLLTEESRGEALLGHETPPSLDEEIDINTKESV